MADDKKGGLLEGYAEEGRAVVVPMGGTGFVSFYDKPVIGTTGLNGCSVALVVSEHAAILSHIPPMMTLMGDSQLEAASDLGEANARRMMGDVERIYRGNPTLFPIASTYVVCAVYQHGRIPSEENVMAMATCFSAMGLEATIRYY